MQFPPCTLYVVQCKTPGRYYVGTTYREKSVRFNEHRCGYACKWTRRHGFKRIVTQFTVPLGKASSLENDVWMHFARRYGPENVRGGDVTIVQRDTDEIPNWLLPEEFGGDRIVDWGLQVR